MTITERGSTPSPLKAQAMDDGELEAWLAGRIPRRLLAIPFGGPLPSPHYAKGADLDGEFFSERTDIKPGWLDFRIVDWHHGKDPTGIMGHRYTGPAQVPVEGRAVLGKAVLDDEPDEDGWWVDLWLKAGEVRQREIGLLQKLMAKGGQIFGSAETIDGPFLKKADTGELLVWPYWRQTLSTSPQNTLSVPRPMKAAINDALTEYDPNPAFWADFADELRNLGDDLRSTSGEGEIVAKAGRVLSSVNEQDIDEALAALAAADSLVEAAERLRKVLARHRKEQLQT